MPTGSAEDDVRDPELVFFREHLKEWLALHEDKYALIIDSKFIGAYDSAETAYEAGIAECGNVKMFIEKITSEVSEESIPYLYLTR